MRIGLKVSAVFVATALVSGGTLPSYAQTAPAAKPLTQAERVVCPKLRACIDIIRRHDSSEFDYEVLEAEFRRFGPAGRKALFTLLETDAANPDMAEMILALGPLTPMERAWVEQNWGGDNTRNLLPFASETSAWYKLLDHADQALRETANKQIFFSFMRAQSDPSVKPAHPRISDYRPVFAFLKERPSAHISALLEGVPVPAHRAELAALLLAGDTDTVFNAYRELYKFDKNIALESLLAQLRKVENIDQATALGGMLARRAVETKSEFYPNFTRQLSGDLDFPLPARAAALDGYLKIIGANQATKTQANFSETQQGAFNYLLSSENISAPQYAPALRKIAPQSLQPLWAHLEKFVIPQAASVLPVLEGFAFERDIITAASTYPDERVRVAARQRAAKLKLRVVQDIYAPCQFRAFDIAGLREQMPFFDGGWVTGSWPQIRTQPARRNLSAAHPTPTGWLAGYDIGESGGGLVHFDNRTGDAQTIKLNRRRDFKADGLVENVVAILPSRALALGETTNGFFVVTALQHGVGFGPNVFFVLKRDNRFDVTRLAIETGSVDKLAVTSNGVLAMGDQTGQSLGVSRDGKILKACQKSARGAVLDPAPN